MKYIKRPIFLSALCMGILASTVQASMSENHTESNFSEPYIEPISYETIMGDGGAFIDLNTEEFLLNHQEWFQIQTYIEGALSLPITQTSMKSVFGISNDIPFSDFQALLDQYKNVHSNAYYWKTDLYPNIVDLALSLSNYHDIQRYMLNPLSAQLNIILSKSFSPLPDDIEAVEQARKLSIVYLTSLKNFSLNNQIKVENASDELLEFSAKMEAQKLQLDVLKDTHSAYLEDDGSELQQRIDDLNNRVKLLNSDYNHYVTVAATAVTYAWFPWAAVPVMGVFGDKAEKARKLRNELQKEAEELESKLSMTQKIFNSYQRSSGSIAEISEKIENAIPYVNKLKLHWQRMNNDFDTLIIALEAAEANTEILTSNAMMGAVGALANTAVAEQNWNNISQKAKTFANKAYIQPAD
ncbi:alpha-xenorhabdolysin family binary toxin subunit A [Vibrio caribbeanicus]|uniref:alpha-xenorhabdolysin family binary toxin subunit A n=1 Tax=Vibrio caribbeanicus TaxID=701175 RepID=UPI002283BF6F|nr:alpha-xenorhabdolysin family binary toxin subunit A [Vibrio caribbeanicus]MCY9843509.1 alpha-xenorhabdolysin family binary toxin subunit A [Vibrio caribbeanicus]